MHKSKEIVSEKNITKTAKHPKNPKNDTQKKTMKILIKIVK